MKKIAFFDTKPYDRQWFDRLNEEFGFNIKYFDHKLTPDTAVLARNYDAVCAFVNDDVGKETVEILHDECDISLVAMRCAGYNNVDFKSAYKKIHIVRVPWYSPYAVAEHAMALILCLSRKIHKAYIRTKDYNFSLSGLTGFDIHGKTIGVVGTGRIGRTFIDICNGFGAQVIAYDPFPLENSDINYVSFEDLCKSSDIISLHCPLTKETRHIVNSKSLEVMKDGVYIINTSRGALIDAQALIDALKSKKVGAAGLDVYEEETDFFFEDFSDTVIDDDILSRLVSTPNVIITSHQAFLTNEALEKIARVTLENIRDFFDGTVLHNEICYSCQKNGVCDKTHRTRCF